MEKLEKPTRSSRRVPMTYCTTREAADMLGISLRTAQLWVENGMLEAWKTEGGHRRITRASIEKLLANTATSNVPAAPAAAKPPLENRPFTILVAEDEPDLLRLYELNMMLWPMRPRVLTASNGFQALVMLGSQKPDMMVADLHMPGMDGFRMLHTLHEMPEAKPMTIVVVSGLDPEEIQARGGVPAGIGILPKPIPFDRLLRFATEAAERKQGQQPAKVG